VDPAGQTFETFLNGEQYNVNGSGAVVNLHDFNNITEELTIFNHENVSANGQVHGIFHYAKMWLLPAGLSVANAVQAAHDLKTLGSSTLLTGQVMDLRPDKTDADSSPHVVRNRITTEAFNLTRVGDAKLQQIKGVNTTSFWSRGLTGGNAMHFFAPSSGAFKPEFCIWEAIVRPDRIGATHETIFGDDNNVLEVYDNAGTDVVTFRTDIAGTPANAESPAILVTEPLYAVGVSNGTNIFAGANGVLGAAVASGTLAEGGEMSLMAQGTGAAVTPMRGEWYGNRTLRFTSSANMPTADEITEIIRYQGVFWPHLHPIIQTKIKQKTCELVGWYGDGVVEGTPHNWTIDSVSILNDVQTMSHPMGERTGGSDDPLFVADTKLPRVALFVGDPTGTSGAAETLGIESNPYKGSTAISTAEGDMLIEGSEIVLGAFDYKTNGNQNFTATLAGRGDKKTRITGGGKSCIVDYITFGAINDILLLGNGMTATRATGGNSIGGSGDRIIAVGIISRDSLVGGRGIELTGADCSMYNCLVHNNDGGGCRLNGLNAIFVGNIATGNNSTAVIGAATGISNYNCWDGTITTLTAGTYDLLNAAPTFADIANDDFTHLAHSNGVHSGEFLPGLNSSWDQGPLKYTGYRVYRFGSFNIVTG
jgi:hypothetical protein